MMKFSEAIRLGATIRPQAFGVLYGERRMGFLGLFGPKEKTSCALGAAFEAGGCESHMEVASETEQGFRGPVHAGEQQKVIEVPYEWHVLLRSIQRCPICDLQSSVETMVPHLNDGHKQTREQIAEWIETVETLSEMKMHHGPLPGEYAASQESAQSLAASFTDHK